MVWSQVISDWFGLIRGGFKRTLFWSGKILSAIGSDQTPYQAHLIRSAVIFYWAMKLIIQTSIFSKWIFYNRIKEIRLEWKPFTDQTISSAIESDQNLTEHTIVGSGVTFELKIVWSQIILSLQSSGQWYEFGLGHGRTIVSIMVSFWSDQKSFPSGKVWSEKTSSALQAHTVFRVHFSLISGHFGLWVSYQRSLPYGTSTWVYW